MPEAEDEAGAAQPDAAPARTRPSRPVGPTRPVTSLAGFDDPLPLHQKVRAWGWGAWLVAAVLLLRLAAVAGMRLYLYVDSAE